MKVSIKKFDVKMGLKDNGITLAVKDAKDAHRGNLVVTNSGLVWCEGDKKPESGVKVSWDDFIEWMNFDL